MKYKKKDINGYYDLNAGFEPPERCTDRHPHKWIHIKGPGGCNSGVHEERCEKCHAVISYDTSD